MQVEIVAGIVAAYVARNPVPVSGLADLVKSIHEAVQKLTEPASAASRPKPAVDPKKSVHRDYIVSLEDGRRFVSMKRHLRIKYGMTPDEYRAKWGLPDNYPMVAPSYAAKRSRLATEAGLGRDRKR